jgi:hypothetical protein
MNNNKQLGAIQPRNPKQSWLERQKERCTCHRFDCHDPHDICECGCRKGIAGEPLEVS